jgi:enoyl-CoA hydratase/carnithine racemase
MSDTSPASDSFVLRRDEHGVCHLTMNRPKAYNALSVDMMSTLIQAFEDISKDRSVRVVILSGAGKGFCAGHDLKELRNNPDRTFYEKTFQTCTALMLSMTRSPKPVIAKIHGVATAAGCQLVATCDLAVAAENARLATPGVNIGLFCSTPMVALSRNVTKKRAMEMLLLGDLISAQRAYEIGLLNRVVSPAELDQATEDWALKIASKSTLTVGLGKAAFYEQRNKDLESAYEHCSRVMVENMLARDAKEGIDAFLEKRAPEWTGE